MVVYESGYFHSERSWTDSVHGRQRWSRSCGCKATSCPLLVRMVKQGIGVTVGLRTMAEQEPGIAGIPLTPGVEVPMALAKRKGRTISRANQAFLDWVALQL